MVEWLRGYVVEWLRGSRYHGITGSSGRDQVNMGGRFGGNLLINQNIYASILFIMRIFTSLNTTSVMSDML